MKNKKYHTVKIIAKPSKIDVLNRHTWPLSLRSRYRYYMYVSICRLLFQWDFVVMIKKN